MSFDALVGNENAKKVLDRLIVSGRMPGSMLFSGPEGVGKMHFAVEFARVQLCRDPRENGACGVCSACARVGIFDLPTSDKADDHKVVFLSAHPDLGLVFTPKRILPVDAIRDLEREANIRPFEGPRRIFIIDQAEKMNDSSANALLKTLEEPPPTTQLILITSRPDSLLPTIRSRVQAIRFAPVDSAAIEKLLIERHGLAQDAARFAARIANGSVARALSIDPESYLQRLRGMLPLLRSAGGGDCASALSVSEMISDPKAANSFEENLEMLRTVFRQAIATRAGKDPEPVFDTEIAAEISAMGSRLDIRTLSDWIRQIDELLAGQTININRKVATDAFFSKIAA